MRRGHGARIVDVDGNEYVDYVCAWGPLILGHAHPAVAEAARAAIADGWIYGASTEWELAFAQELSRIYPSMEMVRFVNSGAEAVQAAVRLARAATARSGLVKLEGCYHGHVESLDMADERARARASGVAEGLLDHTRVAPFNDAPALEAILDEAVAAVIVEPVPGSMGVIPPDEGYLAAVREICTRRGVLLIFDEVLTGFRVALGGAQERFGVRADITVLGKILGGGFAAGAYGASRDLMAHVAPRGAMYQAGTFCGNPLTMRAGLACLRALSEPGVYGQLEARTAALAAGLERAAQQAGIPLRVPRVGSMFATLFTADPVRDLKGFQQCDEARFAAFFHRMLRHGVYLPPSQSDAAVVSLAHTDEDVARTVAAAEAVFTAMEGKAGHGLQSQ